MEKLNSIYYKNLDNKSSRSWDVHVAEITGNLNAALLYGQIAHHHKNMGDFSKSNEELSKELNFSLRTFIRTKNLLINNGFISIRNGSKNKTIYSVVKKLDYCQESYRRYDINYCLINKDINAGILLSQLIYCHEYFFQKSHSEFFKTNKCLMEELFLSIKELKNAKKKLVKNGFIMTGIGQYGRTYYKINMEKIKGAVRAISVVPKPAAQLVQNQPRNRAKRDCQVVPKRTAQPCQKGLRSSAKRDHIINKEYITNIYLGSDLKKTTDSDCDSGLDRQIKEKEFRDEQPTKGQNHLEKPKKLREEPSRYLGTHPSPNVKKQSVGIPKGHAEGKQLTAKGGKKMEPSIMEDKEDVLKMIEIWNETIKKDQVNALSLKSEFKENMMEAFENKFDSSFDTWKEYCKYISLDEFFMGKKAGNNGFFAINLTWALKDESINTILLRIMDSKQSNDTPNDITPSKDFLISEALSSSEDEWLKRIKVVLIDYFYNARKHDGMKSYQSYLRGAKFEVSLVDGKKNLNVKTSFNAFNGLLPYHSLMAKAFQDFEKVTIFGGESDRLGNSLYMERKSTNVPEPLHIWDRLCIEHGLQTIVAIGQKTIEDSCKFAMGIR